MSGPDEQQARRAAKEHAAAANEKDTDQALEAGLRDLLDDERGR